MRNQGEDAFKPELYGDLIIIEKRISESTSSTVLKNSQGLTFFFCFLPLGQEEFKINTLVTFWGPYEVHSMGKERGKVRKVVRG